MKILNRSKKSVVFFTFHKCASILFAREVLGKIDSFTYRDLNRMENQGEDMLSFKLNVKNHLYGPVRIQGRIQPYITGNLPEILKCNCIFMIRDPRDLLVSQYYSYGWTHPVHDDPKMAQNLLENRAKIRSQTIDKYVINAASSLLQDFKTQDGLYRLSKKPILLRYEDMIHSWDNFVKGLGTYLPLTSEVIEGLYKESRPNEEIDEKAHKRSGKTGSYLTELKPETISNLSKLMKPVLERYAYPIN